jgi:NitT/TauT family transport system substrate-binding protein
MAVGLHRAICIALLIASAATLSARPAAAQTSIRFSLDGPLEGPAAPYLVAQDKGYFQKQNLAVRVEPAANALQPITRVASGTSQMGVADLNLVMRWRDQNASAAVKAVFVVFDRPAYAIITRKSRGLAVPADLQSRRLGAPANSASGAQWPLFAKLANIDASKVAVEQVGIPVRDPMLASGQIDAITAFAFRSLPDLKDRGVPANDLLVWRMPDFGLLGYGNVIIVNEKFAADNPRVVSSFLTALAAALRDTAAQPTAAIASLAQRDDSVRREVELERLQMALSENILTPQVRMNGYGGVDASRLQAAIEQQASVFKFKTKPTPAQAFDASFLPPESQRRIN